jgi:peptide/nickel transport system ATP-binding protein
MKNKNTILEVCGLKTYFRTSDDLTKAVDDVSFHIDRGETFALVGESGSGKSVTALSIMRLVHQPAGQYAGGSIILNGKDILQIPESMMRRKRGSDVSMIFQEPMTSLNPVFTIGNQITEAILTHQRVNSKKARCIAIEMLEQVHIPDPERRFSAYPHELSGGMKQRVMIAMALCCRPDLLIADEPTTALDVTVQAQILALIKELQQKLNMAILFITHDLGIVYEQADRVAVMKKGKIVETSTTHKIFRNPQHPYTSMLLDSLPQRKPVTGSTNRDFANLSDARIKVENLKVLFPIKKGFFKRTKSWVRAVDGVDFFIPKGKTIALVGESGCGKTTIGKSLVQLLSPTDGTICFDNSCISNLSRSELKGMRKKIQIVFQDPYSSLNPRMIVGDIINEALKTHRIGSNAGERDNLAKELLQRVGIEPEQVKRYPHEFSGGQRQRICIARALAVEPDVIVFDEATSALDVSIQARILELLCRLQEESNLTYLFITHNLGVVEYLADYVLVMYKGRIVERGSTAEIFDNPQHPYTQTLLAAVPQIKVGG